jgi:mutator protein MutT
MELSECRKKFKNLRQATLLFLLKEDEVLLAMKKRGFGIGKWNGVGGKVNPGETIEETTIRETKEEIGVSPQNIKKVATLNFYFPHQPDFSQQVIVYFSKQWQGEPSESDEMKPAWYKKDKLPFDSMWPDDPLWLPRTLKGQILSAGFVFGEGEKIIEHEVVENEN